MEDRLNVLWTTSDLVTSEKMVFMYTHNAKKQGWFDDVVLIVWGPSALLLSENIELQQQIKSMQADGVVLEACIACADMYGVSQSLLDLGIDVKGMGVPLSNYLKEGWKVLTF